LQLVLWLFLAWVAVYLVIIKGVKSSGKISYFLAIFPYVVMLVLLIRAVTLDGAMDGIKFFITPDFKRLLEPQVSFFPQNDIQVGVEIEIKFIFCPCFEQKGMA
jgi:solute carrier family 6 (neurotransmitter transporter, glycine) member 5/9